MKRKDENAKKEKSKEQRKSEEKEKEKNYGKIIWKKKMK